MEEAELKSGIWNIFLNSINYNIFSILRQINYKWKALAANIYFIAIANIRRNA